MLFTRSIHNKFAQNNLSFQMCLYISFHIIIERSTVLEKYQIQHQAAKNICAKQYICTSDYTISITKNIKE